MAKSARPSSSRSRSFAAAASARISSPARAPAPRCRALFAMRILSRAQPLDVAALPRRTSRSRRMVARVSEQKNEEMKFETSEHLDLLRYGFDQGRARCDGSGSGVVLVGICFAYVCCLFVAAAYLWQRDVSEACAFSRKP